MSFCVGDWKESKFACIYMKEKFANRATVLTLQLPSLKNRYRSIHRTRSMLSAQNFTSLPPRMQHVCKVTFAHEKATQNALLRCRGALSCANVSIWKHRNVHVHLFLATWSPFLRDSRRERNVRNDSYPLHDISAFAKAPSTGDILI